MQWHQPDMRRLACGTLDEALAHAGDNEICLIVPGECILLTSVNLPPIRQLARRMQAARFAMEDQLATPVESQHIALGERDADGNHHVAVVEREQMDAWLDLPGEYRQRVRAAIPDTLCLPLPENGSASVLLDNQRALVRRSRQHGFACNTRLLPAMLQAAGMDDVQLQIATADDAPDDAIIAGLEERGFHVQRVSSSTTPQTTLFDNARTPALNLLQGSYEPVSHNHAWWRPFRATAALAIVLLLVLVAAHVAEYVSLQQEYNNLHAQAEKQFHTAFPDITATSDMRYQAQQALARLSGNSATGGIFPLLQALANASGGIGTSQFQSLDYRSGALTFTLHAKNIQALDKLRGEFSRQSGMVLDVQSANATSDGVQIQARVTRNSGSSS